MVTVVSVHAGLPSAPVEGPGIIESVTVYRGQALVTRRIEVPGPPGLKEVTVSDLPERIVPGSLHAEIPEGGLVRSVRYRERPVAQDVREDVRNIDGQIRGVKDRLEALAKRREVLRDRKTYIGNLEQFAAATAGVELSRGVLNAETLKALTLFLGEQRESLTLDDVNASYEERDLREQLNQLQRERDVLTGKSARTAREAVAWVDVTDSKGTVLHLHYLAEGAAWSPSFNVRAQSGNPEVVVEYFASIRQMTGEDWGDVSMTLSTATPSLVACSPELSPLAVTLTTYREFAPAHADSQRQDLRQKRKQAEVLRNVHQQQLQAAVPGTAGRTDGPRGDDAASAPRESAHDWDSTLNELANEEQMLEMLARFHRTSAAGSRESESLSVTYELPKQTSLQSRADQQLVQIARLALPAEHYEVGKPVLTEFVYREAFVTNTSELVLLAGPATTYMDGQFVGRGSIPGVTTGQRFSVGLGIDPLLRAERELVDRVESIQGGNRMIEFTYRIALENFGDTPANVRVYDRLPMGRDIEVKCTLVESQIEESADTNHRTGDRKTGILRWDVEVAPGAVGHAARSFEYKYKLEFDKGMMISVESAAGRTGG
jgi:hypothetical protein